ncbi:orotate phosphoribosyltransferase [bacterium D16-76]|nr:orotate phosphoribosyltransferase [bacterium D16-76]
MLTEKKKEFIQFMLSADVLRFGQFVTKSGRHTQYFVNTGNYKTGAQLSRLGRYYAQLVADVTGGDFDAMFGPAYKGIPLASACAMALYEEHQIDKPYLFNRKEVKDHGEGGSMVGYKLQDGDRVVVIEDVVTAGTALRESIPLLKACADVRIPHMFISVDRCEVGQTPGKTAIMEVEEEFGIQVHPLVTVVDIYEYLKGQGTDPALLEAMEGYMKQYCILP